MGTTRTIGLLGALAALLAASARGAEPSGPPPILEPDPSVVQAQASAPVPSPNPTPAQPPRRPVTPARPPATTPPPTQPAAPAPAAPAAPAIARETAPATGAAPGGQDFAALTLSDTPIMLGDQGPFSILGAAAVPSVPPLPRPPTPGQPPVPGVPGQAAHNTRSILVPWLRGFKIADNQSPRPQDRVFFSFNYFNDLNGRVNARLGNSIRNQQAFRELFGFEKTFLDGNASIGIRMPLNTLTLDSNMPGLGGSHTAVGNLSVFSKLVLWQDQKGNLLSAGLAVTAPTGPTQFAGAPSAAGFHDAQIQPFLGFIRNRGRFYLQGFKAIDIPTDPHDVTMGYTDLGVGYFLYRNRDPNAWLTSIAPTFETHVNLPLNHRGSLRRNDPAGTPDVVDLTLGMNFVFGRKSILSIAFVDPVTGPKPFSYEFSALLNVFYGRTRYGNRTITPPVVGL